MHPYQLSIPQRSPRRGGCRSHAIQPCGQDSCTIQDHALQAIRCWATDRLHARVPCAADARILLADQATPVARSASASCAWHAIWQRLSVGKRQYVSSASTVMWIAFNKQTTATGNAPSVAVRWAPAIMISNIAVWCYTVPYGINACAIGAQHCTGCIQNRGYRPQLLHCSATMNALILQSPAGPVT